MNRAMGADHQMAIVGSGVAGLGMAIELKPARYEDFQGALFHSAQWDHVPLHGKRIGVIGTGASAIQLVPRVAREAGQVTVFQRTPPWVVPKLDRPIGRLEQTIYAKIPLTQKAMRA